MEAKEKIYVSKKTGKIFLMKKEENSLDLENPVERDLSEYKFFGGNMNFSVYERKRLQKGK